MKADLSVETFAMLCILEHHFSSGAEHRHEEEREKERKGEKQDRSREEVRGGKVGDKYKLAG